MGITALAVLAPSCCGWSRNPLPGHRLRIAADEQMLDIGARPAPLSLLLGTAGALERLGTRHAHATWTGVADAVLPVPSCRPSPTT